MGKESFLIYSSFYKPISKLSDKQLGRLFRAIFKYHIDGVVSVEDDLEMAFAFFINQFEIDESKYQSKVERNRENGRKGGMRMPKRETAESRTSECPRPLENSSESSECPRPLENSSESSECPPINDNDNDNDNVDENEKKKTLSDESVKKDGGGAPSAPTPYMNFMQWMREAAPNVHAACGGGLTEAEFVKLRAEADRDSLIDCVLALENRRDLLKKYRSLYLTLRNWLRRDAKK